MQSKGTVSEQSSNESLTLCQGLTARGCEEAAALAVSATAETRWRREAEARAGVGVGGGGEEGGGLGDDRR